MEVVEISSYLPSGLVVGRELPAFHAGHLLRQRGSLNTTGHPKVLFDALPLLGLLLLLGHGDLELLGTLCDPVFEILVEPPDLFSFLSHLSIRALQTVVESRVLHNSEDLPQQHQADQQRSPDIDSESQASTPRRGAPGID